jgi:NTP pyrophosphatase (non-canonical NTP hydrolase)
MVTLEEIRSCVLSYMSEDFNDNGEYYDEDGHCGDGLWNSIKSFWIDFKTDEDFLYVVSGRWISDDLDLDGGRSYIISSSGVIPLLFDYLYNTLNYSLEDYENIIFNTLDLTDEISELYKSIDVVRNSKIGNILETSTPSVNIWSSFNFGNGYVPESVSLEEVYNEIRDLDSMDPCSISEAVCKFSEESGEWIREINKTTGRKVLRGESLEEVHENIMEEAADTLQNLLLICSRFDISLDYLMKEVSKKNKKWKSQIPDRQSIRIK